EQTQQPASAQDGVRIDSSPRALGQQAPANDGDAATNQAAPIRMAVGAEYQASNGVIVHAPGSPGADRVVDRAGPGGGRVIHIAPVALGAPADGGGEAPAGTIPPVESSERSSRPEAVSSYRGVGMEGLNARLRQLEDGADPELASSLRARLAMLETAPDHDAM